MDQMAQPIMDVTAQPFNNEVKNTVEIVVHVIDELTGDQRSNLVSELKKSNGITGAEFCPLHYHLMLVRYNRNLISSQDVLGNVTLQKVNAHLIGPV